MPADPTQVANQALGWLGAKRITSFLDNSVEAGLIRENFDFIRDAVLEDRVWTFADSAFTLSAPTPHGWDNGEHMFLIPSNVLRVYRCYSEPPGGGHLGRRLHGWRREGANIVCSQDGPIYVKATLRITDPDRWTAAFTQALAARLAADLAIPITKSRQLQADLWSIYQSKMRDAAATDASQGGSERTDSTELVGVRWR